MSYTIEYDRIFLRSAEGFTPCWLSGDNNVYESSKGNAKRVRSWSCFQNLIGVTEEEIFDSIGGREHLAQSSSEYWKRHGKFVDGPGVFRWIQNGCRRAVTVEELLQCNSIRGFICSVHVYDPSYNSNTIGLCTVHNTEELDTWIRGMRLEIQRREKQGQSCYPRIDFSETLRHPIGTNLADQEEVLIKDKNMYLCELDPRGSSSWSRDITKAMKLTKQKALELIRDFNIPVQGRLISAKNCEQPYDAVLQVVSGSRAGCYVYKVSNHSISFTRTKSNAKKYANEKKACAALERIKRRGYSVGPDLKVVVL